MQQLTLGDKTNINLELYFSVKQIKLFDGCTLNLSLALFIHETKKKILSSFSSSLSSLARYINLIRDILILNFYHYSIGYCN